MPTQQPPQLPIPGQNYADGEWGEMLNAAVITRQPNAGSVEGSVVFTFDDGTADHYTLAHPVFAARPGTRATFFVVTSWLDTAGYLTTAQAQEMMAWGHEIASHTHTHMGLQEGISESTIRSELDQSKTILASIGSTSRSFAWPSGYHSKLADQIVGEYYDVTRGVMVRPWTFRVAGNVVRIYARLDSESETALKAKFDAAKANRTDLVVMAHVTDAPMMTKLGNLLDYAATIGLPTRTLTEAYDARVGTKYSSHGLKFGKDGSVGATTVDANAVHGDVLTGSELKLYGTVETDSGSRLELGFDSVQSYSTLRLNALGNNVQLGTNSTLLISGGATRGVAFADFPNNGIFRPNSVEGVGVKSKSNEQLRAEDSTTDTHTGILVRVNRGGTYSLDRVTVGAADSGGAGFRVLRVAN